MNEKQSDNASAIDKVLDILLMFTGERIAITIEDIQSELRLPQSTAYRYVKMLIDKGFLHKSDASQYQLGIALVAMSRNTLYTDRDLRLSVIPSMKRISEATRESVSLMRLMNQQVVCIESIEGQYALRVMIERGRVQPIYAGASSKVILAHVDRRIRERLLKEMDLVRFTKTTIADRPTLEHELASIRERGYAVSDGEIDIGARAVAVPLHNHHDEVVAALSIEAPHSRMGDQVLLRYIDLLITEARHIRDNPTL